VVVWCSLPPELQFLWLLANNLQEEGIILPIRFQNVLDDVRAWNNPFIFDGFTGRNLTNVETLVVFPHATFVKDGCIHSSNYVILQGLFKLIVIANSWI
jgi:hypothetical protein